LIQKTFRDGTSLIVVGEKKITQKVTHWTQQSNYSSIMKLLL